MNAFDQADESSFAYRDLFDMDSWDSFTPSFSSLTVVGATSYSGRKHIVGKQCFFQVKFSAATSIASTAGTTYFTLPVPAKGLAGAAAMSNDTAKTVVGVCHVDAVNSRCYLPAQAASGNVFNLSGWCEV